MSTGCCPNPLAIPSRMMLPFLKYLAGGRCPFHGLSVGETAGPAMAGQCGGGKNPPQISRRKDQAGSLGTKEKAESSLALIKLPNLKQPYCVNWIWATACQGLTPSLQREFTYQGASVD